ncbi:Ulp1 protease family carboxy-terminal domain protein, partial [Trifolium medium]|nr:Ulp1 protease family carboxy-terminal domain protein [Trifolium medium]
MEAKFEEKFAQERKMMQDSLMETLRSMDLSQTSETNNKVIEPEAQNDKLVVTGSAKGSCSAAPVPESQNDKLVVIGSTKVSCSPAPVPEVQSDMDDVQKLLMIVLKMGDDYLD